MSSKSAWSGDTDSLITVGNIMIIGRVRRVGLGMRMLFISLFRFKKKPTKEMLAESQKLFEQVAKQGGKILGFYWTLGRYDGVVIVEGADEKIAMKSLLGFADFVSTETLVAIPGEEAGKLVE